LRNILTLTTGSGQAKQLELPGTSGADVVELIADFPEAGAMEATIRINTARKVGTLSLASQTNLTDIAYAKNGAATALPVSVVLNDVLTVLATAGAGGGILTLEVS